MVDETPTPPAAMPQWILKTLALVLGLGLFLVGLVWLGKWALAQIREQDRYTFAFKDIDCTPPPGLKRGEFLDEVRYVSEISERLRILDDDLAKRLSDAFAQHPWLEKVDQVLIEPPQHVRIRLVYRIPVLAVLINEATKEGAVLLETRSSMIGMKNALAAARAVDKRGILLPPSASLE